MYNQRSPYQILIYLLYVSLKEIISQTDYVSGFDRKRMF